MLWYPLAFFLALGILVTVHELGHYAAARLCGIQVLRFSIGFGHSLWSRRLGKDGTEWSLGLIPLGGYVRMLDEREAAVPPELLARAFNRQPVGRRAFVVVAGPLFNLLLAVVIYWGMFLHGVKEIRPLLGTPVTASAAAMAGIQEGELVVAVNGEPIQTWSAFRLALLNARLERRSALLDVMKDGASRGLTVSTAGLSDQDLEGDMMRRLGFVLHQPHLDAVVGSILTHSPAQQAGLLPGDKIVALNGRTITHWGEVVVGIRQSPARSVAMEILRGGQLIRLAVIPEAVVANGQTIGRMGAAVRADGNDPLLLEIRYGPLDALRQASRQTWDTVKLSLSMMGRMIMGDISWKNISGPVTIADYAGQTAQMGLMPYIRFIALISISLGVLNLLPIPILDGGHLMYYLAEFIKGSPVSEPVMALGQRVGFGILGLLMAFALFNDFQRLFFG